MTYTGWLVAAFVILVLGVSFANTRALLMDFSPLEIQAIRFAAAWLLLFVAGRLRKSRRCPLSLVAREWLNMV
ncbi:MAG: hypothetical protein J6P13_02700 [Kiritimatiellae bacterium]|nr:hypothetical protein [Kiritimatiellia bacterium]